MVSNFLSIKAPGPIHEQNLIYAFIRGGSFLCNDSYCSGYRNAARMKTTPDSSSLHTGFSTVYSE